MTASEPSEWVFSSRELPQNRDLLPTISNGFLGTKLFDDKVFAAGIFNGDHLSSHRAMIPSTLPINITVLNVPEAKLEKSYTINSKIGCFLQTLNHHESATQVQQKVYAHKQYRNLIITELKAKTNFDQGCVLILQSCAATKSKDIDFQHEKKQGIQMLRCVAVHSVTLR